MDWLEKIFPWRNKNMIKLIIKDTGFTIDFEGKKLRTPAELNIPQNKLNNLLTYLKSQGISNYSIISGVVPPPPKPEIKKVIEVQPQIINNSDPELINRMLEKFESLEQILKVIADKEPVIVQSATEQILTSKYKKNKHDDEPDTFIPTTNTDSMEVKSGTKKKIERDIDASDAADALSSLQKGK